MYEFDDRRSAGRLLADRLAAYRGTDAVVLGLPRGGVVVAAEVARELSLPLDVVVVRKLGVPWRPEVAMGAIAEHGVRVLDEPLIERIGVSADQVVDVEERERATLEGRIARLRAGRPAPSLTGRTAIIVDDGIATGATATVAAYAARARGADRVVVAAPVAPAEASRILPAVDDVVTLVAPRDFLAVGAHYRNFGEVDDDDVARLLSANRKASR